MRTTVEPFDDQYPPAERLPCTGRFEFVVSVNEAGRPSVQVRHDGRGIGDPLTDNSHVDDGYRVHDVFHLAYAAMLGWSPVTTKLMGRKRKSNPEADEAEDGGRAIVSEEGHCPDGLRLCHSHNYLDGVARLDLLFLNVIKDITAPYEVGSLPPPTGSKSSSLASRRGGTARQQRRDGNPRCC
jgi:MazG-like nucleotide pyrophosphohydrolase family protein